MIEIDRQVEMGANGVQHALNNRAKVYVGEPINSELGEGGYVIRKGSFRINPIETTSPKTTARDILAKTMEQESMDVAEQTEVLDNLDKQFKDGGRAQVRINEHWSVDINIERNGDVDNLQMDLIPKLTPDLLEKAKLKAQAKLAVRQSIIETLENLKKSSLEGEEVEVSQIVDRKIEDNLATRPLLPEAFIGGVFVPSHSNPVRKSDIRRWVEGNANYELITDDKEIEFVAKHYGVEVSKRGAPYVFKPSSAKSTAHVLLVGYDKNIITIEAQASVASISAVEARKEFIRTFNSSISTSMQTRVDQACDKDKSESTVISIDEEISKLFSQRYPNEHPTSVFYQKGHSLLRYLYLEELKRLVPERFKGFIESNIQHEINNGESPKQSPMITVDLGRNVLWGMDSDRKIAILPIRTLQASS
ncbi:hypothetical protein A2803_00595 [Candidatus Woesebacteria bacterium RIFCSPHIGHO2_01_FULL_44_21]|uniref:Uncharacterized protein n=1 Tax=Candidatus Woesebacteria bacterium RIFCSPHIGHO2_01_FULL_44_21 TaxID=1802503 RepID=A0A1F7YWS6_9BACT|nr:MAG: hypothetical protein A2803_00595 [Candidatus Woesebacteria bacterium RIFCSPHIGHO2_01_FULL_44_21]OGM69176.1 MAG: hypothetical protein A2897_05150 [Candidatus Woesebacteria bacterium RIFCSPLOWO2_01_FULL_44_24b]